MRSYHMTHRIGGNASETGMLSEVAERIPVAPVLKTASATSIPEDVLKTAKNMGLVRLAGNIFSKPASKDFWKVDGDKIVRLVSSEVDLGETLEPTSTDDPEGHIASLLADLES